MSVVKSSLAWGEGDGQVIEDILCGVTDKDVPRIREVLVLFSNVLNHPSDKDTIMALEPSDPVLTDAMRCILCHRWIVPSVHKKTAQGEIVQSFFTQPFLNGQVLSLYSSSKAYEPLLRDAAKEGVRLLPVPRTLGQVVMAHLPTMGREAVAERKMPESQAVIGLAFDAQTHQDGAVPNDDGAFLDNVCLFLAHEFLLLQSFCLCYALAGKVLEVQETLAQGPEHVKAKQWDEVLCQQALTVIMTGDAVFASEVGMLFFCYPGDASKALAHHLRKGTPGIEAGKVKPIDPVEVLDLMEWGVGEGNAAFIAATVVARAEELQLHGLSIPCDVFSNFVVPALSHAGDDGTAFLADDPPE